MNNISNFPIVFAAGVVEDIFGSSRWFLLVLQEDASADVRSRKSGKYLLAKGVVESVTALRKLAVLCTALLL